MLMCGSEKYKPPPFSMPGSCRSACHMACCSRRHCGPACSLLNVRHLPTTAFHPQSIGLVEGQHLCLKEVHITRATGPAWIDDLPWALLQFRRHPSQTPGCPPLRQSTLVLPGQFTPAAPTSVPPEGWAALVRTMGTSCRLPSLLPDPQQAKFVLICHGSHQPPALSSAYTAPTASSAAPKPISGCS